jgi:DNA-binding transcriptional LysR family regulator
VLNNPFFLIDPNGTLYSEHITSQFYAACFPPVSPPSPPLARPPPTPSSAQVRPAPCRSSPHYCCCHLPAQHSSRSAVAALPCCWSLTLPCLLRLQGLAWSLAETMAAAVAAVALLLAA